LREVWKSWFRVEGGFESEFEEMGKIKGDLETEVFEAMI
jgi:hypothetical protein